MSTTTFQVNGDTARILKTLANDAKTTQEDIVLKAVMTYEALLNATDDGKQVALTQDNQIVTKVKLP